MKNKIIKWLDFNFWWVFVNGYKQVAEDIIDVVENHYIARS